MKLSLIFIMKTILSFLQFNSQYDKIWIYDFQDDRGLTSASAIAQFITLEKNNTSKKIFEDIGLINQILNRAIVKKHFQSKLGNETHVFCIAEKGTKNSRLLLCGSTLVIDFTLKKNYWIKDEKDQQWLAGFIEKVKTSR